jgi:hypothetical protein
MGRMTLATERGEKQREGKVREHPALQTIFYLCISKKVLAKPHF